VLGWRREQEDLEVDVMMEGLDEDLVEAQVQRDA
jgi:hypothetical protein